MDVKLIAAPRAPLALLPARIPSRRVITALSPYPYFGGKSKIAGEVWKRFGDVPNFVEPFFGSGAVLLSRPHAPQIETVNDKDGYISNFWRAVQAEPETVAQWADWPVNENDLHARHAWLLSQRNSLTARLEGNPDYYDAKVAGWWVWGMCAWIGSGFCSGNGPWQSVDGELVDTGGNGVRRNLVHLGNAGQGINRQLVHLGDAGRGINRKRVSLGSSNRGLEKYRNGSLYHYFDLLRERMRYARVCSGDWKRVLGDSPTTKLGLTAIFLDPPYAHEGRDSTLYNHDHVSIASEVRDWAIAHGDNPLLRIAYCGYEDGYTWPAGWTRLNWTPRGGFEGQRKTGVNTNRFKEVVYFSPHCIRVDRPVAYTLPLFTDAPAPVTAVQAALFEAEAT